VFSFGRVEIFRGHRLEQSSVRDLQTAPRAGPASRHALNRSKPHQRLAGPRDDDLFARERAKSSAESFAFASAILICTVMAATSVMF
jgi:hypothetical protein